jgi:hypothetical protein
LENKKVREIKKFPLNFTQQKCEEAHFTRTEISKRPGNLKQ